MIRRAPETNGAQGTLNGAIKRQPPFLFGSARLFWGEASSITKGEGYTLLVSHGTVRFFPMACAHGESAIVEAASVLVDNTDSQGPLCGSSTGLRTGV